MNWYTIVASHVRQAEESLIALGHTVYYPKERVFIVKRNKRLKVRRPLLYKYIFVEADTGASFYGIRTANGVHRMLEDSKGNPISINPEDVDRFKRNERYGLYDHTKSRNAAGPFKSGQVVRVIDGAFTHWEGCIERCGQSKAWVYIGNRMMVQIPLDFLVAK